jgi:DeoR/GlpR family transcriptional regulator of sugar metabolism
MLANQRRDKIFELIQEDGSAKVIDLAKLFKVTEVTIRQDLEKLEKMASEQATWGLFKRY